MPAEQLRSRPADPAADPPSIGSPPSAPLREQSAPSAGSARAIRGGGLGGGRRGPRRDLKGPDQPLDPLAPEDLVDEDRDPPAQFAEVRPAGEEPAGLDVAPVRHHRRQPVLEGQLRDAAPVRLEVRATPGRSGQAVPRWPAGTPSPGRRASEASPGDPSRRTPARQTFPAGCAGTPTGRARAPSTTATATRTRARVTADSRGPPRSAAMPEHEVRDPRRG
jgi:hypothetical protein